METGEPAPVLAVQGDVGEVLADEPLTHPVDVIGEGVVGPLRGLVGATHPHKVEGEHSVAAATSPRIMCRCRYDHVGFPWRSSTGPASRGPSSTKWYRSGVPSFGDHLAVVGREVVVLEVGETVVGRAQDVHQDQPLAAVSVPEDSIDSTRWSIARSTTIT